MNDRYPDFATAKAANEQASVLMKRGIALLETGATESLAEAVDHFNRAIELRRQLPLAMNPLFRYGLAAGWMNRADALTRLGNRRNLDLALHSYDEAITLLQQLPLGDNPNFPRRLAIAWQNRGLTLQAQNDLAALGEAERSLAQAIAVLQNDCAQEIPDRNRILATVWMNRANVLILQKNTEAPAHARIAAKESLLVTSRFEMDDLAMAEISIKARHILCQAIARLLDDNDSTKSATSDWINEATDAVDEGLALAREWEQRGIDQFRPQACELFRFGARVYQAYQPHFLSEFLLENLDASRFPADFINSPAMRTAAMESLWRTFRDLQRQGFKTLNSAEFDKFLTRLQELRLVEERLREFQK